MGSSLSGVIGAIDLGHGEFYVIITGVLFAFLTFFITFQHRRRNMSVYGITDVTRAVDGRKFREASNNLYGKYFENKDVSESDLQDAAQQIRSDLVVIQGLIESRMVNTKLVFETYSDIIVKTMDSYKKFLDEFEPTYSELNIPIQRIYNTAVQWIKVKKLTEET